jgi:hypothetical protein
MRKKLAVVVLVGLAVVTGLWFLVRSGPHRINGEGFDQITAGMTQREVEEILGGPPGDYTEYREVSWPVQTVLEDGLWFKSWVSDDGWFEVAFNTTDDLVAHKHFYEPENLNQRPWRGRVRRAFGRSLPSSWRAYLP